MKKTLVTRLLAIFVCMAMLATVTPIFAAAETTITEIEITDVDTVPYIGENAADYLNYTLPEDCHYSMNYFYWYDEESGDHLPGDADTFEAGKEYSRRWNLVADEGYTFGDSVTVTINGVFSLVDTLYTEMGDDDTEYVVWMKPTAAKEKPATVEIKRIDITDVDLLPLVGDKTNDHIGYTFPENCHFTAENHFWYDHTTRAWKDGADDVFEDGHSYRVGWWLYADEGYSFAEFPTITINGGEDIYWSSTYIDEDSSKRFFVWTNPMDAVEPIVIDKIEITNADLIPVVGETAGNHLTYTIPTGSSYTKQAHRWFKEGEGGGYLASTDVFEKNCAYTPYWELSAAEGYTFADSVTVTVNGKTSLVESSSLTNENTVLSIWGKTVEAETYEIEEIKINNADLTPIVGEKAGDHLGFTLPENCHYTSLPDDRTWYCDTDGNEMAADDVFEENKEYSLIWILEADEGYTFYNYSIWINNDAGCVDLGKTERVGKTILWVWTNPIKAETNAITEINIVNADVTPIIGKKASECKAYSLPSGVAYSCANSVWYDQTAGKEMASNDVFESGHRYSRQWRLSADEGYVFGQYPVITINGKSDVDGNASMRFEPEGIYFIVATPATEAVEAPTSLVIDKIEITDVDLLPLVGDKTNDHIGYTFPENCHFTAENHFWYDHTASAWKDGADDVFEDGHSYRVGWWLRADEGYSFAEHPTITINGGEDIYWSSTYIDEDNSKRFFVWTNPMDAVEPTVIDKIEIDGFCDAVVGGKAGNYIHLATPEDAPYHFDGDPWWVEDAEDLALSDDDIFEAGKEYTLGGWLIADKGYIFAENPEVLLNGGDYPVDEKWTERDDTDVGEFHVWSEPKEAVEPIVIDKIEIIDADVTPILGEKTGDLLDYTLSDDCHFTVDRHYWYNEDTGNRMESAAVFEAGPQYDGFWYIQADSGYTFSAETVVTINGTTDLVDATWTEINDEDSTGFYVWTNPTEAAEPTVIDKIEINGFCDAVAGGKAGDYLNLTLPEDAPYHFGEGSPRWYNDTDGKAVYDDDTFEAGKFYSLGGVLVADVGYIFAEKPEIVLNGGEVSVLEADSYRNDEDTSIFYAWGESKEAVEAPAALLGDANDDGAVNMKDVLVLRKQLGGMNPEINMTNADCNEDGTVNMKDVLLLRKYLASMVENLGA